MLMLLGINFSV